MKCPYCGIHYMDDERECPICGKRNPGAGAAARETAHHHAGTPGDTPTTTCSHMDDQERDRGARRYRDTDKYPSIRQAPVEQPVPENPAGKSAKSAPAARTASDWSADKQKKKGAGAVAAVVVIALVLQFLPALIEAGETFVYNVRDSGESQVFDALFGGTPEPDYTPASAPEPARTTPAAFSAASENRDLGITLTLDDVNETYRLVTPDREETGTFYWWYNDEEYYYTEDLPEALYDCFTLSMSTDTVELKTDGADSQAGIYYLDVYVPVGPDDQTIILLPSLDLPVWMEDETPIVLTRQ